MQATNQKTLRPRVLDIFSYVAVWQGAGFLILLLLVWINELLDIPAMFAGRASSPPDIFRGCVASAGVFFAAIITIGQTYLQQRSIVGGMLTICCYCQKIRIDHALWQRIEEYISHHSEAVLSHGICPDCFEKARREEGLVPTGKGLPGAAARTGRQDESKREQAVALH